MVLSCSMRAVLALIFVFLALQYVQSSSVKAILEPKVIEHLMYTELITGIPNIAIPTKTIKNNDNVIIEEKYTLTMKKIKQKILPGNYPETTIYAYGANTDKGQIYSFPGPTIVAQGNVMTKVTWRNQIQGEHILPVDYSQPFNSSAMFKTGVPTVPHAHGLVTKSTSDGEPQNYWTSSGQQSGNYHTEEPCQKNQAVYQYTNQQGSGLFWYHDHTIGITRLNVYAGLAGFYEIMAKQQSFQQKNIRDYYNYGQQIQRRYFTIADKTFQTTGQLFYPDQAYSALFTSWIPQFFGNTITVNGKVWPKVNLSKQKYRMIFLNACNARFLNIYFVHLLKKIPFQLLRAEADYYANPIVASQFLLAPGARIQIMIDLTQINGEITMKNNAQAPYPSGDPGTLIDKYTGSIMKMQTKRNLNRQHLQKGGQKSGLFHFQAKYEELQDYQERINTDINLKQNAQFPAFPQGEKVYITLSQHLDSDQEIYAMFFNGISMETSSKCEGLTYKAGKVYDFYFINLTNDMHPIHFHLIDQQKVKAIPFDADKYKEDWLQLNGEMGKRGYETVSKNQDPLPYKNGAEIQPTSTEKVFRDIINATPGQVTVIRISFTLNDGRPFSFDVSGTRFVWHCHMLEHEDNEMMIYYCLE